MRKIVSLKKIDRIVPIENADAIETAKLGGWNSVVKKGEYQAGDTVIYCEVDTFLPTSVEEFSFLAPRGTKTRINPDTNQEVEGHTLKTMKLRGVVSQGLILPISDFGLTEDSTQEQVDEVFKKLGVFKYEPPLPAGGAQIGSFPTEARKTDSERVQNLTDEFLQSLNADDWYASEKIDGTSSTFVKRDGKVVVASRNWTVDPETSLQGKMAQQLNLSEIMPEGAVIQGEVFGEGIQQNPLKISGTRLMVFSAHSPVDDEQFNKFVKENSVPVLDWTLPQTVEEAIEQVNKMKSTVNPQVQAEGVVWWNRNGDVFDELDGRSNFKAINNAFLMKHGG